MPNCCAEPWTNILHRDTKKMLSKFAATESGTTKYDTGAKCLRGHFAKRYICNGACVECSKLYWKKYRLDPEKSQNHSRRQYARAINDPRILLLANARKRAKKAGVPCTINLQDIVIPDVCPALGILLVRGRGKLCGGSPTLDRIVPSLGYVKGNIAVISHKANSIKQNATASEILSVAIWLAGLNSFGLANKPDDSGASRDNTGRDEGVKAQHISPHGRGQRVSRSQGARLCA
ncbi:MAG: hypothetical protein DDT19_02456 [Syntrophomonadaceae bacterium]|nr:hypothetical protein [Bacillota bacterium]